MTMRSGPDIRARMVAHAARLPAERPKPKPAKPEKWPPKCLRCGENIRWKGEYWRCGTCGLDGE